MNEVSVFFYGFLVIVALAIVTLLLRSPVGRQLRRGRGSDTSPFGNRLWNVPRASNSKWNDDGHGGMRDSYREQKTRPLE